MVPETRPAKASRTDRSVAFGTGLIALDVIVNAEGVGDPALAAGGTCGNVLAALSFLGWASYPVARLNGDAASRLLQEDLARWGVVLDFACQVPSTATPIILQTIRRDAQGAPAHSFSLVCPECRSWFPRFQPVRRDSADALLRRLSNGYPVKVPEVFFFDRVSRASLLLAEHFAGHGSVVVFEPSGIGKASLFNEALELAHVLKYSRQRLGQLATQPPRAGNCLLEIETLGAEGLRYRSSRTSWSWRLKRALGGPPPLDCAGAGDWCTAGVLSEVATGGSDQLQDSTAEDLETALNFGQAAAAIACGFEGARGAMYALAAEEFRRAAEELANQSEPRGRMELSEASTAPDGLRSSAIAEVCPSCDSPLAEDESSAP